MSEVESPQINRRTTRSSSSSSTPNAKSTIEASKKVDITQTLSVNDLLYGYPSITFGELIDSFPGRRSQINELVNHLGPLNSPMIPLFVYGGPSTGKTNIILQIFRFLNRPFVYASCVSCYSPRLLFESILNQVFLHRKHVGNGYSSVKRCEKPSDFVHLLREGLATLIESLKGQMRKSSHKKSSSRVNGNMIYLIFDNLELVREWEKSSSTLSLLFNLYDILKMAEVGVIFVSNASPDMYQSDTGYAEPFPVYIPGFTEDDLRQIFMRNQANPKLYSSFLDMVLKPFCRITRQVDELATVFSPLFKKYCEPLDDLGAVPNEVTKRKLFSHLQPCISLYLNEASSITSQPLVMTSVNKERTWRKGITKKFGDESLDEIDFHMSTSAKYLLISAFLASRNPATLDAALFDSTGGPDNRKRKRKSSEKLMEQKESKEQELLNKGPGTFPLERLLAIFQCITYVLEYSSDYELQSGDLGGEYCGSSFMSDIVLQLSSLCSANFITKGGSCPLEGSIRYRSTISEDFASKFVGHSTKGEAMEQRISLEIVMLA
ncbi:origin recognition complex subunit 5 [Dorcoceras hygrometricum]|uniref:Origin recognition complex subunit 5 n=1 Tax=Dorcoceras hygrometricum TaxID=472368 RepID=A0A2Z7BYY1_9LAMI|nr:origin recognition complex subunit 5 [Dorcoceras hygrometricum]